jgi:hypothetical protein
MTRLQSLPPIRESEFRQQVVDLAKIYHWRVYFTWASIHCPAGFPDLTLVKNGHLVFAELKTGRRKTTWEQQQWIAALEQVPGVRVFVWRPEDWGHIERILRGEE